jgi:alpha-tubulin suppressor-like RCC1 family protein
MVITAALDTLTDDRVNSLNLIDDLPEAYDVSPGTIFFVKEINTLVYASAQNKWKGLDGRVLREDPIRALAWGNNLIGQLGDNTTIGKSSPITVVGGILNWAQVSAGGDYVIGLTTTGIVYAWGNNTNGRLGDNTIIVRSSPVTVVGGISGWSQVSAGFAHSLGIAGGIAYAWGNSQAGRLGDNTTVDKSSPVTVVGSISGWSQVSAGRYMSVGIANNVAYAWGNNTNGRLGNNTIETTSSPVSVVGNISWKQLSAYGHTVGVSNSKIAYAWGPGGSGQLGNNSAPLGISSPVTVVGGITNWSQVSAGRLHSLGITESGVAYAWGSGANGRNGDDTIVNRSSPVTVVGGITEWSQVSAGSNHSVGLTLGGDVYAWGLNTYGQIGNNTVVAASSPVTVVGGITTWNSISAGQGSTVAIKTD